MHDHRRTGIPGFFPATLVVIYLVFVLMALKWKASTTAKKGESRKLLVSEAQETAAFVEDEGEYMSANSVTVETPPQYECAVCFRAASKRCGRCKVVRYWSERDLHSRKDMILDMQQRTKQMAISLSTSQSLQKTDVQDVNANLQLVDKEKPTNPNNRGISYLEGQVVKDKELLCSKVTETESKHMSTAAEEKINLDIPLLVLMP